MRVDSLKELSDMRQKMLREMILIGSTRNFEQDPEFGVIVMSEVANRALGSGINDPQTAVDVVHRLGALLMPAQVAFQNAEDNLRYDRLWVKPVSQDRLYQSSIDVIAREGGDIPEVHDALRFIH